MNVRGTGRPQWPDALADLGEVRLLRETSHPHGEARVWEVEVDGDPAFVKQHRGNGKFVQERDAYLRLDAAGLSEWIPRLLWSEAESRTIVTRCAPGVIVDGGDWSPDERVELCRQAGAFRRALDDVPCAADPLPIRDALEQRMIAWVRRAAEIVDASTLARIEAAWARVGASFDGQTRRWCHRDFSPRNWVAERRADGTLRLRVIDFGQSRADHPLVDRLKLWDDWWERFPECEPAFGPALDSEDASRFEWLAIMHGLATVTWSVEHGDPEYEARGRRVLTRVLLREAAPAERRPRP